MLMRKFLSGLVLIPLAVLFVVFAVANRHLVTVSFDPFNTAAPSVGVTLPLFIVLIAIAIMGVIAGGLATWFRQRRWRRAARLYETEARQARQELAELRQQTASAMRAAPLGLPVPLLPGPGYTSGRDKTGVTL
jgi:uncharacterized integral membrane protein